MKMNHYQRNAFIIGFLLCLAAATYSQGNSHDTNPQNFLGDPVQETSPSALQETVTQLPVKEPQGVVNKSPDESLTNVVYITLISVSAVVAFLACMAAAACWHRHSRIRLAAERVLYRSSDSSVLIHNGRVPLSQQMSNEWNGAHTLTSLAKKTDYPAYGVTGPNPLNEQSFEPPIDKTLNKSAEVFHYNQTKKRIKALSSSVTSDSSSSSKHFDPQEVAAELEVNDEETSDGEYTVYECSGFAATIDGPMEVCNPLFDDIPNNGNVNASFSYQESMKSSYQFNSPYPHNQQRTVEH